MRFYIFKQLVRLDRRKYFILINSLRVKICTIFHIEMLFDLFVGRRQQMDEWMVGLSVYNGIWIFTVNFIFRC